MMPVRGGARRPVLRRSVTRRQAVVFVAIFPLAVAGLIYAGMFSPWFRINGADVIGGESVSRDAIAGEALNGREGRSLFRLDARGTEAAILSAFPELAEVAVGRRWPRRIDVVVRERVPRGAWCTAETCTLFDETGAVWGSTIPSSGTLLMTVADERTSGGLDAGLLRRILTIAARLEELDIGVLRVQLPDGALQEAVFTSLAGYPLRFLASEEPEEQLDVLESFLADRRAKGPFLPSYIDLRVDGKVYFK